MKISICAWEEQILMRNPRYWK